LPFWDGRHTLVHLSPRSRVFGALRTRVSSGTHLCRGGVRTRARFPPRSLRQLQRWRVVGVVGPLYGFHSAHVEPRPCPRRSALPSLFQPSSHRPRRRPLSPFSPSPILTPFIFSCRRRRAPPQRSLFAGNLDGCGLCARARRIYSIAPTSVPAAHCVAFIHVIRCARHRVHPSRGVGARYYLPAAHAHPPFLLFLSDS
ncbi:hypothetical protein C8F04DRAFT_1130008, partial [Mycena alexandri]